MKIEFKKRLYYFLLGMLGFASVSCKEKEPSFICMYGPPPPYIDGKMSGKVTDKNNNPIKGIRVQAVYSQQQTLTESDGSYEISQTGYMTQILLFTDIDGVENGGEFAEQIVDVTFTEANRTGEDSFERTDVDVEMEEAVK